MLEIARRTSSGPRASGSSGRSVDGQDDPGSPWRAWSLELRRSGGPPRRCGGLRSAQPDVPVRAYICVVDAIPETGQGRCAASSRSTKAARRHHPMIVEGQVHGGLADGIAWRSCRSSPSTRTAMPGRRSYHGLPLRRRDCPSWSSARRHAVTAPARRQGRGRVGHRGLACCDRQLRCSTPSGPSPDMPLTRPSVGAMQGRPFRTDLAID